MFRRTVLSHASRIRPFSSLTSVSTHTSILPSTSSRTALIPSQRSLLGTPSQWRNATVLSRWSSSNAAESTSPPEPPAEQTEVGETVAKPAGNGGASQSTDVKKLQDELEGKNKEVVDLKDKYLRSVADFRNLQDRTSRQSKTDKEFAIQKFARDLLESIDNLDRALSMVPQNSLENKDNKDLISLYDGLKMTETVLLGTLEKHGLTRFNPEGEKFNPNMHEATFEAPMEGKEVGSVFHVQSKGYALHGRVLRAARVGVVKAP